MRSIRSSLEALRGRFATPVATYAALAVSAAGVALLATSGRSLSSGAVLGIYAGLFGPYLVAIAGARDTRVPLWVFVASAVVLRLFMLPASPLLSDDLFRYVWDGRVALSGTNPFVHPPASDALAHLRDAAVWPKINHPEIRTIYPPGAQYLFMTNALFGGGVVGLKALFVGLEAACVGAVGFLVRDRWNPATKRWAFVAYALNPLIVVEVAWSGHLDVVAWGLLVVGLVAWQTDDSPRGAVLSALALGASAAVKFLGLVAVPLIAFDRGGAGEGHPLGRRLAVCAAVCALLVASYLPMLGAGAKLFSGFGTYAGSWRGNDGPYRAVRHLSTSSIEAWARPEQRSEGEVLIRFEELNGLYREMGWTKNWQGKQLPDTTFVAERFSSKVGKGTAIFALGLAFLWCLAAGRRPLAGSSLLLFVLYLFAPIVHPWYVAWLVPLAAVRGKKTGLVFSFVVLAAYLAWYFDRTGGPWHVPHAVVAVEYTVVVVALWLESSFATGRNGMTGKIE